MFFSCWLLAYFYPRSPCGERLTDAVNGCNPDFISIHALLAESDSVKLFRQNYECFISIHALLAESDDTLTDDVSSGGNFYPRSPCGERRWLRCWQLAARDISIHALLAESDTWQRGSRVTYVEFLSTLSLRRATSVKLFRQNYECFISIHALLAESDSHGISIIVSDNHFYPRSPCGERPTR